jgi:linoleate 10R-lipoxygenase
MMRRFSSVFKKSKEDTKPTENTSQTNGKANGKRHSKVASTSHAAPEAEDHSAKRTEVVATFEKYAQLIHASRRPLPTRTGDGTYLEHETSSGGLFQDLRVLGFKDYGTVLDVIKNKASGGLVDDKTMLMERIIQVYHYLIRNPLPFHVSDLRRVSACQWSSAAFQEQNRTHECLPR